jgi:threonine aldolase
MKTIDLRSDTVTKPSAAMRQAIFTAEVGDDVFGEDPSVNQLEAYAADLLGKEASLFVATGTQGNLLSVLSHCERGDEYIAGQMSHLYRWEAGGSCVLGSAYPQPIEQEADGTLDLNKVKQAIKPDDSHFAITKLLALENTHWGKALPLDYLKRASEFARSHNLKTHLDGARLFNASVATRVSPKIIADCFDSVTFCLSKGLGAPAGSLICGNRDFIAKARRLRKMVGGGMRQAGILAAAGEYALRNNIDRLAEDHENASLLAKELQNIQELQGKITHHTNMVFVEIGPNGKAALPSFLHARGILVLGRDPLRLVTHLDVDRQDLDRVILAFKEFYSSEE